MNLYQLTADLQLALDDAFDPETGEALPLFEERRALWGSKATGVAAYILNVEADAAQCKQAIERIKMLQAATERKAERLRDYLATNMLVSGINEIKGHGFAAKLYIGRDESVEIDEGAVFPPELCGKPKLPPPSKTLIKSAIERGEPVAGARIVRRDRLTLK